MIIRCSVILVLAAAVACSTLSPVQAEDTPAGAAPVPARRLAPDQFGALPPTAVIEINGRQITKAEFLAQREAAIDKAFNDMKAQLGEMPAAFAREHRSFIDAQTTKLDEANRKVSAEVERLGAADAAAHGSNWDTRREQAATLLKQADATEDAMARSELEKQAADLLAPAKP